MQKNLMTQNAKNPYDTKCKKLMTQNAGKLIMKD